jgi:two-component system LytT family response regulator
MEKKISTLIVEKQKENNTLLKLLLEKYAPHLKIVGCTNNYNNFIEIILSKAPDLLFLDLDVCEQEDCLQILNKLNNIDCEIIILGSTKQYAVKAINHYHIAGYIVKPIDLIEITNAINNAVKNIQLKAAKQQVYNYNTILDKNIALPLRSAIEIIQLKDIIYLEADGKYTTFHLKEGTTKLASKNIGEFEKKLPQAQFYRIHNKYIININKMIKLNRTAGNYCEMVNGASLTVSKRKQEEFKNFLIA